MVARTKPNANRAIRRCVESRGHGLRAGARGIRANRGRPANLPGNELFLSGNIRLSSEMSALGRFSRAVCIPFVAFSIGAAKTYSIVCNFEGLEPKSE